MQAATIPEPHQLVIDTVDDPRPAADEVVVRVRRAGLCGTDLHIYRNEYMATYPIIPGHEFVGEIVELGQQVHGLKVDDRVVVDPNLSCGCCDMCRRQAFNHCLNWQGIGITRPGAFAQFVSVPAKACFHIPEALTDQQCALVEPLSCVVWALQRLQVDPGDDVLIFGAGPMGLLLTQALRHRGASQVVVVDKQNDRLARAAKIGATATVSAGPEQEATLREHAAHGFDVVVDATGAVEVIERALKYLRPRGRYLQFGVAPNDKTVTLSPFDVFRYDWTILGSFALCYTFGPAIAWLEAGIIDVTLLVSATVSLSDFPTEFERFANGQTLKVHVSPGET